MKNYNKNGAWDYKPFGFKDLEHPIYHYNDFRLIDSPWVGSSYGTIFYKNNDIDDVIELVNEFLESLKVAKNKGANVVSYGDREIKIHDLFNPTCYDTRDKYSNYKLFCKEFQEKNGKKPSKNDLENN